MKLIGLQILNYQKVVCNLVRPDDVHYLHIHQKQQVCLYYVNLDWRDGWHGETLFYNPDNLKEIVYTSLYVPVGLYYLMDQYLMLSDHNQ